LQTDTGRYFDTYRVTAIISGTAIISVRSPSISGILGGVSDENADNIIALGGEEFNVTSGQKFIVFVTGDPHETGDYLLTLENLELQ